jgi:hypothetical protein
MIPVRIPQTRTPGTAPESQIGLFRQVLSTSGQNLTEGTLANRPTLADFRHSGWTVNQR